MIVLNNISLLYLCRVKSFSFEKMGLTMEIPRVLSVGNVAVRVMHTRYDHLSPLSKSFYPRRKIKPPEVVVEEAPAVDETNGDGVKLIDRVLQIMSVYN